jgi:homoserine kinase type II
MAALTDIKERDLCRLLTHYDLGALKRYWAASDGIENTNYFVEVSTDAGPRQFVLTIFEREAYAGDLMVDLLDCLSEAGLPVAPVIRNRFGAPRDTLAGKPAMIAPRLPGTHVVHPTVHHCEAVGRLLARLQRAARPLSARAPRHPRDAQWLAQTAALVEPRLPYAERTVLDQSVRATQDLLARDDTRTLPQGIIHGDLFRDNVLFQQSTLCGVVDFHQAAAGYYVYDVAVALNDWCTDAHGVIDIERAHAMLRGCHHVRPFSTAELWLLPGFLLYGALAFWLSRLAARSLGTGTRSKRPDEFRDIVAAHLARSLHVDRQLLG